jgi:hypothetical protein
MQLLVNKYNTCEMLKTVLCIWMPVAPTCNPSYLGGWDQEDHGSRPAWKNSSKDSMSKITREIWTGGVAQVVDNLLCKCKALSSNSSLTKKKVFCSWDFSIIIAIIFIFINTSPDYLWIFYLLHICPQSAIQTGTSFIFMAV